MPDSGGSRAASDLFGETQYVPVTFVSRAGVCDAPDRTEPGAPDGHDVLRAARGIIWITVLAVPFWSGMLLLLYWL